MWRRDTCIAPEDVLLQTPFILPHRHSKGLHFCSTLLPDDAGANDGSLDVKILRRKRSDHGELSMVGFGIAVPVRRRRPSSSWSRRRRLTPTTAPSLDDSIVRWRTARGRCVIRCSR